MLRGVPDLVTRAAPAAPANYHGDGVLRRDVGGGAGQTRQAEHLQHRPMLAVHSSCVHRAYRSRTPSRSARTAQMRGETTYWSSGCGAASNKRRCGPIHVQSLNNPLTAIIRAPTATMSAIKALTILVVDWTLSAKRPDSIPAAKVITSLIIPPGLL
jgi:hypothetical protein